MATKPPNRIIIRVNGANVPEGTAVMLRFLMEVKHYYSYIVFLDAAGGAELSKDEYLSKFDEERRFFLMDYVDFRVGFTGLILPKIMTKEELENAISAYDSYKSYSPYREGHIEGLQTALALVKERGGVPEAAAVHITAV